MVWLKSTGKSTNVDSLKIEWTVTRDAQIIELSSIYEIKRADLADILEWSEISKFWGFNQFTK